MIRIGHGYDVHAFTASGDAADSDSGIVLGGVRIAYPKSLKAHSDGDVVLHALCDALLGAAGLGDIGQHFPDSDAVYRGIDSRRLLASVMQLLGERDFTVNNVDITIVAQAPKMAAYIAAMRANIASDLAVAESDVNVKATTTEHLGYIGRGEGIAVHAVTTIDQKGV